MIGGVVIYLCIFIKDFIIEFVREYFSKSGWRWVCFYFYILEIGEILKVGE